MGFTTYKNVANPHVTIHRDGCNQIKKRGRLHKYNQGTYDYHSTYGAAQSFAKSSGLIVKDCSFCKPK